MYVSYTHTDAYIHITFACISNTHKALSIILMLAINPAAY